MAAGSSVASASLTAAMVAAAGGFALGGAPPPWVAIAVALSFLPYAGLIVAPAPSDRRALHIALGLATAAGVILVAAPSVLSDDLFRYLWDGRVCGAGIDPYLYAPDAPALFSLRDALHARVNNPEIPTIYPPFAQLVFWVADCIDHAPWTLKALALAAHLATVALVFRATPTPHAGRAALLYGLNPLALSESALGGHVDVFAGLSLLAFAFALARGRAGAAILAATIATGTKLIGLVVAPLLSSRHRAAAAFAFALSVLVATPLFFAGRGSDAVPGLGQYARRWAGNAGLYRVLESGARVGVDRVAEATYSAHDQVRVPALAPVVRLLDGTPFDPWATQVAEKKEAPDETAFQRDYAASMLARGAAFLLVVGLVLWLVRRRVPPLAATRATVLAVLLLAPQIHPWYLLWLLPLEVATGGQAGLLFSATILAGYAPLATWLSERRWEENSAMVFIIHLPVVVLLAWEIWLSTNSPGRSIKTLVWERFRPGARALGKIQ